MQQSQVIPEIAVVILNWNGKKLLEKYLPSVVKHSAELAAIYLVDNASVDNSVGYVRQNFPEILIVELEKNYGFTGGYNESLKQIQAECYVLLNSDVEVTAGWLTPFREIMKLDEKHAVCQPMILSDREKDYFEYAGAGGGFIDKLGYPFCRGRIFNHLEKNTRQYEHTREVFWATGACMCIKADLFHSYGGFDSDFFAHMEEIDLCWRLKNDGYKIFVCHDSVVYHLGGGTLPKKNPRKTRLNFRNNLYLLYKNLPNGKVRKVLFTRFFLDVIALLKFAAEGHFKDAWAVVEAYREFFRNKKAMKAKRKTDIAGYPTQVYQKSIVYKHYLKGLKVFSKLQDSDFTV